MKKRLLIVAGVILVVALAFGMGFWKEAQATNQTSLDKGTQRKTTENELPSLTQCTA